MVKRNIDSKALKVVLKEAIAETLREERPLLHEIFAEVLEDFALGEAIREGLRTERASREEIFGALKGQS